MNLQSYQQFSQLLESCLTEDSTAIALVGSAKGGKQLVQWLHQNKQLPHDQKFYSFGTISWNDLKNTYEGAWVLIQGSKGVGAIRAVGSRNYREESYEAVAFDSKQGRVVTFQDSKVATINSFLKPNIGTSIKFYVGIDEGEVRQKREKRMKPSAGISQETLVKKFKPLWLKAMTAAEADLKGMIATMVKNNSYNKAKLRINQAERLAEVISKMETGTFEDTPAWVKEAVGLAIYMTASHYYPEQTGDIRIIYGAFRSAFKAGPRQLLTDIAAGDQKKLLTVLGFFKRNLITG